MHDQNDDPDQEENPGDLRGNRGYAEQTEGASHEPYEQERECVVKHVSALLASLQTQLLCQSGRESSAELTSRNSKRDPAPGRHRRQAAGTA